VTSVLTENNKFVFQANHLLTFRGSYRGLAIYRNLKLYMTLPKLYFLYMEVYFD